MTPIALTIAGSDSGGGAGIQADLKTFAALGVYGTSAITAITAQNTLGVSAIHDVPARIVSAQIRAVLDDIGAAAIKIGMLSRPQTIAAVAGALGGFGHVPVVLDPVMIATSGAVLIADEAILALKRDLMPGAALVTPNLHEAAFLTGMPVATSLAQMQAQAQALIAAGAQAVLLKGGHGDGAQSIDLFLDRSRQFEVSAPRIATTNTHGTGCTLSSAIAAFLARGLPLADAVREAKTYVTAAIAAADRLKIGQGHGPLHHFHALW